MAEPRTRRAHTVEQVRSAEQVLLEALPDGALMARAATGLAVGVAEWLEARRGRLAGARVLLVVGGGDNGGDALFAGAWLARRGVAVSWLPVAAQVHRDGQAALERAGGRRVELAAALTRGADVALDAVVGIGGRPGLQPDAEEVFVALARAQVPVIAVDLPSGVDVDTGETPATHVVAEATFTFGSEKVATLVDPAAAACGRVQVVDIGLAFDTPALRPVVEALTMADVRRMLPRPGRDGHKYTRGVVGVSAGSRTYPGAALLCVGGANTGLAGMVRYVGPTAVRAEVVRAHPEVVGEGRVQAWAVGSGTDDEAAAALERALADGVPVVVDADALAHVVRHLAPGHSHQVVLTPHAGELAAMLGVTRIEIERRPLHHVRAAAERFRAVVLLKGARTLVADPDGPVRANTTGTPWLGTAGAGDVLAGVIAALLAAGSPPRDAAALGALMHGVAAEQAGGGGPLVASDLPHGLRQVLREAIGAVGDSKHE